MKRQEIKPSGINEIADSVTRSTTEAEDIDLAAEATEAAPAKSLQRAEKPSRTPRRGTADRRASGGKKS